MPSVLLIVPVLTQVKVHGQADKRASTPRNATEIQERAGFSRRTLTHDIFGRFTLNRVYQSLLEEHLSDGRQWLFDTEIPGLVDISAHAVFGWITIFNNLRDLFDPKTVPHTVAVRS